MRQAELKKELRKALGVIAISHSTKWLLYRCLYTGPFIVNTRRMCLSTWLTGSESRGSTLARSRSALLLRYVEPFALPNSLSSSCVAMSLTCFVPLATNCCFAAWYLRIWSNMRPENCDFQVRNGQKGHRNLPAAMSLLRFGRCKNDSPGFQQDVAYGCLGFVSR